MKEKARSWYTPKWLRNPLEGGDPVLPIVLSPETAAATKANYKSPKSEAQTKADSLLADARVEDVLINGITISIPETAITPAK